MAVKLGLVHKART